MQSYWGENSYRSLTDMLKLVDHGLDEGPR